MKAILTFLNGLPDAKFLKKHGTVFGVAGEPDIYGCLQGRMVMVEVKRPGERPTRLQGMRLYEWERAGALAFWADSVEAVKEQLIMAGLWNGTVFGKMHSRSSLAAEASELAPDAATGHS